MSDGHRKTENSIPHALVDKSRTILRLVEGHNHRLVASNVQGQVFPVQYLKKLRRIQRFEAKKRNERSPARGNWLAFISPVLQQEIFGLENTL